MTSIGLWGRYNNILVLSSTLKLVMHHFLCLNVTFSFLFYWEIVDYHSQGELPLVWILGKVKM